MSTGKSIPKTPEPSNPDEKQRKRLKITILRDLETATWNIPELPWGLRPSQPESLANSKNRKISAFRDHKLSQIDRKRIFRDG